MVTENDDYYFFKVCWYLDTLKSVTIKAISIRIASLPRIIIGQL
jgi:hypothetical protein